VILTKDEAHNVPRTFASVPPESPLFVLDAESRDATVALARARGAETLVRPWTGFVEARRFALGCVRTPWTFMLDADEALDAELVASLRALEPPDDVDAYEVRRLTFFCDRPIRYGAWGDEAPLRLFRTERATLVARPASGGDAELHETWHVPGSVGRLRGTLLHASYPTLASYGEKFARYTSIEARGAPRSVAALARAALVAFARAPWLALARGGWRDGWRGLFVAAASAAYPVVVAWKALRR
jgi:hypothetical protein